MPLSPDVLNYYIGKGIVTIQREGEGSFRDVGNVPEFEITPELTELDHHTSREGVKTKDETVVTEKGATLRIIMEEITANNLAIALMGDLTTNTAGDEEIDLLSLNAIKAEVKFVGSNDVGQQIDIHLLNVKFIPSSAFSPISEEWGQLEISGDILSIAGKFGTATVRDTQSV